MGSWSLSQLTLGECRVHPGQVAITIILYFMSSCIVQYIHIKRHMYEILDIILQ